MYGMLPKQDVPGLELGMVNRPNIYGFMCYGSLKNATKYVTCEYLVVNRYSDNTLKFLLYLKLIINKDAF